MKFLETSGQSNTNVEDVFFTTAQEVMKLCNNTGNDKNTEETSENAQA
jgi:hypothetical protein